MFLKNHINQSIKVGPGAIADFSGQELSITLFYKIKTEIFMGFLYSLKILNREVTIKPFPCGWPLLSVPARGHLVLYILLLSGRKRFCG